MMNGNTVGRSLRRALDRKVRRLSSMSEADMDISTELDLVVCRLLKLALRMSNGCELPLHPRWLECKLYDLLSLTEKSITRRKTRNCATLNFRVIDYGMEEDRSQRLSLIKEHDELSVKRIEETYRHLVQFKDTTQYVVDESLHSACLSQSSPMNQLSTVCTSRRMGSDFDTGSPCPTRRGIYIEEDYKSFPISSSVENIRENEGIQSWPSEDLFCGPFVHQPSPCENSTDDTYCKEKGPRQKSPTKKKRKVVFPKECNVATDIETSGISPTIFTDDSGQYKPRIKKEKNSKINRKTNQKSSYNSLMKNYAIHLAQAEKDNEISRKVVHHDEQPTAVKPIPCSLINLCYEELAQENAVVREWSHLEDRIEDNVLKETDLATEETQIMSLVMDDIAGLQENIYPGNTTDTHNAYLISYGVDAKVEISKHGNSPIGDDGPLFLSDLNEPSTSKGIRHVNIDAQCGPDTGSLDIPLLTRTPSVKLQKMFKTGIVIGDSSTELKAETKEIIDFATSTSENYAMRYVNSITENDIQRVELPVKSMCDASTLYRTTKRNNANRGSVPEFVHKSVSSTMTDAITDTINDNTEEKQASTTMTDEKCPLPLHRNSAVEAKLIKAVFSNCNKIDDSISDHSALCGTYSPRLWRYSPRFLTPSPQHKEVQSTDTSVHAFRSLYDKQYTPPKLSFVGALVHSYKDRVGSEDILYQGVWQKNKMQWASNKRSHCDFTPKNILFARKANSKEKIISSRLHNSTSDIKNSSATAVKRTAIKLTASKDFIAKNMMLSGYKDPSKDPRAKKIHGSKKSAGAKSKQNSFYKKASLVFDKKRQLTGPIVVKKEQGIVVKAKQNIPPNVIIATRKPHSISTNVSEAKRDKPIPKSASYSITKREILSDNAVVTETKHDFLTKNCRPTEDKPDSITKKATMVETKPNFIWRKATMFETKPEFISKNATIINNPDRMPQNTAIKTDPYFKTENAVVETKLDNTFSDAKVSEPKFDITHSESTLVESKPDLATSNTTFVESKPDVMPKKSAVGTKSYYPNYTKVIEMHPDYDGAKDTDADPEFLSSYESLAKLKQDIISSNEVLARLQQDFEQKVEKRILGSLGSRNRKILSNKNNNKVPSKNSPSPLKPERTKQSQNAASSQKTASSKPKSEQMKRTLVKPINTASKTLIKKTSLKNLRGAKTHQKAASASSNVPNNRKRVNFKDPLHMKRPSSATPAISSAKGPVRVNSHSPLKSPVRTPVRTPVRPRSADADVMKQPQVSRPPIKRSIWMPKQSAETKKLTKDVLKAHDASHPGRNYLAYCSEFEGSDSTDCSILHEDPDTIKGKFYVSSSRTSSNCSSPNSVVTVRSRQQKPSSGRQTASMSKVATSPKENRRAVSPKTVPKRKRNKDRNVSPTPVLKVNVNEKLSPRKSAPADYNRNVYVAQLSPETTSPLCLSPNGRKCRSPIRRTSLKQLVAPVKPILKISDVDESALLNETSADEFTLSGSSSNTLSQVDTTCSLQPLVATQSGKELNESTKQVMVIGSQMCEEVTEAAYKEVTTVLREIIEETLKEIDESFVNERSRWPRICAKTSSNTFPKEKMSEISQRGISKVSIRMAEIQGLDLSAAENTKGSSIKDLYERKEQLSFKPAGSLAIQAFSGFSMNMPPPISEQKPDYVNIVDSETGSAAATIPTRLATSEELYISGRSSESYQSCMVDDEMVVPDWLFHVVSQDQDYDDQYDDDEENYPMPMPTGPPVPAIALQEGYDLNGNLVEGVPTVARTGAGDGRGIHSDQSQDSSGQGTSLTSSANSSGPHSTMVLDPTVYPSRYDSMLESLSDDDTEEAESSRPGHQRISEAGTPMSSTERIYTLLNQVATSDVDADVSSIGTDDNVSRSH